MSAVSRRERGRRRRLRRERALALGAAGAALASVVLGVRVDAGTGAGTGGRTTAHPAPTPQRSATPGLREDRASGATTAAPRAHASRAPSAAAAAAPSSDDVSFTILSAGDVLPHANVNRVAALPGGGYDFVPLMAGVREWTAGADLALCSLEVPLAPPGQEVTGYPVFGAPAELVTALAELGWDGCATATNHALDRGTAGVTHTLDMLDAAGLGHVGTARSAAEAAAPQLYRLERGGRTIVVAHLSATAVVNGRAGPSATDRSVTGADPAALTEQARTAREAGADVVVANLHWGVEYAHSPDAEQLRIATALAQGGQVDVVLGSHPHVPQPIDRLPGGPRGEGMWVAWSMGNFLSNQDEECCTMETATGVMTTATVQVPARGPAAVTALEWTPVTVDVAESRRVHALNDLAAGVRPDGLGLDAATIAARDARVSEVMGTEGERLQAPRPTGPEPTVLPRPR
ncbi:poly-gamma-glutamate synthesis protein (capsule biosynthesis protein) [Georgenia soli]|uniref:Poly-gamma-glutamate synthesis protein (Capsule biosynthesis protein) n=1 Tax=Georgenia soli TaxID=638953 RepID=A0A2A9EIN1_9MICO|nr:CapA family protein [Georgenia soli]PFG38456.1 poly-gamma-glutamate synthesis protein (capsule biosynthesis protein) [Georgenia soli]